ncbi:unnamed protein product [Parnassius apollo]|uniref:(apollo) hypothetical protein n=1 Tax=Parnassius apollo TaxID=110799 RepID=A0A8S3X7S9_PARAO|nr:unnamed protein product [Parnassius apollo]
MDKENISALPKKLLLKKIQEVQEIQEVREDNRIPLKTVNSLSGLPAGSSTEHSKAVSNKTRSTYEIDSKYVTFGQKNEDLDWDYKVIKDEGNKDCSIISISDEEESFIESEKKEYNYFNENKQKNGVGEAIRAATPLHKSPLEPNRVRNIKKNLKTSHSGELQGLSPVVHPEKKGEEKCKRRLTFNERLNNRLQLPDIRNLDYLEESYTNCIESDYVNDLFAHLLSIERPVSVPRIPSITRARLLNWLLRINGSDGNPAVIQTASWYLDSVLSICSVWPEQLQQVAAACFWIAQKIHGPVASASMLIKFANGAFSKTQLLRAEEAILMKLKFPSQPVVPQDYITYLSWWLDDAHPDEIEIAAVFLCLCGLMVNKTLCNELPSVIAAACLQDALLLLGKWDLMLRLETCPVFKAAKNKTTDMYSICSTLRTAVRIVSKSNEYKAPMEIFGTGPHFIAQKIVKCAYDLEVSEVQCTRN